MKNRKIFYGILIFAALGIAGISLFAYLSKPTPLPKTIEQVKEQYEAELMRIEGVVGVGIGECDGEPCIKVYLEKEIHSMLFPIEIEGFKVDYEMTGPLVALPNPASVYCKKQRGYWEIRKDKEGNESGFCLFEDGSECDEWKFFRGECKKGERFCKDLCGDGICQELVCMAIGCPCSETPEACPSDCKQTSYIFDKSKFCPDYGDCNDYGLESRKCSKIGDCAASCAYGCVSKKWMEGKIDCEATWENFECECIDDICQRK